ncbi:MAG: FAD-binding protein, partial [Candidatus Aegiribacteria sp.]|nr:FAD-binding protein [Candidatus Aegiribacteria sp.]MBD3295140.1 FAD-binding protein [Candidatus Fermentibacteria bacterium]
MKAEETAAQCRHYAMCKIDGLGTGVCPAGKRHRYVSFYPQGRMDIYARLVRGELELTRGLVEIAESCVECGKCDIQCYFATQLKPSGVAAALKKLVKELMEERTPVRGATKPFLKKLRGIVGEEWATGDPAHLAAYCSDPCPISRDTLPSYVAMPSNTDEVRQIVDLCREEGVEYSVRGNGSSVMGFVLSDGLVMDMARMDGIRFDEDNWCVRVGAGVSSFMLQSEARERGYRVNAAEPAALYCSNIVCSGIFSLYSSSLGTAADNVLDAEFISKEGTVFRLSQKDAPNCYAFSRKDMPPPGVCTEALVRLHPVLPDEKGILVPFSSMEEAVDYTRELGIRRIGSAVGLLGREYFATFTAPTAETAAKVREVLSEVLEMEYMVLVLGDEYHLNAARQMAPGVIEQETVDALVLGMPGLLEGEVLDLVKGMESDEPPYRILTDPGIYPLLEAVLRPSPERLASCVDEELKAVYRELYSRPELTDMVWLNDFRIVSTRMGREGHVVAFIVYLPLEDSALVKKIDAAFRNVAQNCGVRGTFGFLTPLDTGKMAVLEWDMYLDHTDEDQVKRMQRAMGETAMMLERLSESHSRLLW